VSKRSTRTDIGPPADGLVLLPPQAQPLSAEQRAEAVALLSDLLLAAPRDAGDGRDVAPRTANFERMGWRRERFRLRLRWRFGPRFRRRAQHRAMGGNSTRRARLRTGGDPDKEGSVQCLIRVAVALRALARCA
jgi:hypothetical protein